jgi:SAM-dependent methyltransferase
MHFTLIKPDGFHGFDDIILPLHYALSHLGWRTECTTGRVNPHSVNIAFGAHNIKRPLENILPKNSIIFNLEPITSRLPRDVEAYIQSIRNFTVWDFSRRNVRVLRRDWGLERVEHVRLGYVPEMTRLAPSFPQDVHMLFYGAMNKRRAAALRALEEAGIPCLALEGCYGQERDYAIARAECVVNIHHCQPATLEVPRLGYLWANRRPVLSERNASTEIDPDLEPCCRWCDPTDPKAMIEAARELVYSKPLRAKQAEAAFAVWTSLRQEDFLLKLTGRPTHAIAGQTSAPLPKRLNIGSGNDFRQDYLNIDIDPSANPDLVLDFSLPLDPAACYQTKRFGTIRLTPGCFERVQCSQMLEHVRDLPQTMRNILDMLSDGGEAHIDVPYDLSCGAWQDPTHVRAMNEKSWLYFAEHSYYLGWRDARFDIVSLDFMMPPRTRERVSNGEISLEEVLRLPREVSEMRVVLRKRQSTPAEKEDFDILKRSFYEDAVGEWRVDP